MATIRETILEYPSIGDMEGFLDKVVFVKRGVNPEEKCTTENMKQVGLRSEEHTSELQSH